MIIVEKIKVKVNKMNIKHILSKGYNVKLKDIIYMNSDDLSLGSHIKVKVICDTCKKEKELSFQKYIKNIKNDNFYACSSKCAQEKVKKTSFKKFGKEYYMQTDEYLEKVNSTNTKKYGGHHTQNKEIKEKQKETCLKKYGAENYFKSEEFKENNKKQLEKKGVINNFQIEEIKNKSKETCLKKYGVPYSSQSNLIKEKKYKTNLEKYGFKVPTSNNEIKKKVIKTTIKKYGVRCVLTLDKNKKISKISRQINYYNYIKNKYTEIAFLNYNIDKKEIEIKCKNNHNYLISRELFYSRINSNTELCTICNNINKHNSGLEIQLYDLIKKNYDNKIITNSKSIISPLELDIYLPELNLAFEFNGLFWHSEVNKENNYHLNKTEECEKQGIQLIHIWEDDWLHKQDIVKSIILNKLGKSEKMYARKTEIKEVTDNKIVRWFLNKNHIQGFVNSKIKIGLFYNDELVSLMTFGNRRVAMGKKTTNKGEYELLRFCNKLNTNIVGGASKLFKYFIDTYKPEEITTYADRSFSQGNLYKQLKFNHIGKTQPNYYYIVDGIRKHRFNFRKDKLVRDGYDANKTEHEIMLERKIYRIFDSGNLKFILKK